MRKVMLSISHVPVATEMGSLCILIETWPFDCVQ